MSQEKIIESVLDQLRRLVKSYKLFSIIFIFALTVEIMLLIFFFPFLVKSALFAITLAALLITVFSFYTLRNYQKSEKEEALKSLSQKYIKGILSLYPHVKMPTEMKRLGAQACLELTDVLNEKRNLPAPLPRWIPEKWAPYFAKVPFISCLSDSREELSQFQRILLVQAAEEFAGQIRFNPCSIEAHAALASTYLKIASLAVYFKDPSQEQKAQSKAIEEFKILSDLNPQDLGVLNQLATCYKEMNDIPKEIEILEKIRSLAPYQAENLLRLGQLYFIQSESAKGFRIYEILKSVDLTKSDHLMASYQ